MPIKLKACAQTLIILQLTVSVIATPTNRIDFLRRDKSSGSSCPSDLPYSCTNKKPIDNTCCFESPGGVLLQTQFWDYSPAIGDNDSFTLHGLWPDNCDGSYEQFCNKSLEVNDAKQVVLDQFQDKELYDKMSTYWKNNNGHDDELWTHEFNKHATCINTIKPQCYGDYKKNDDVHDFYKITVNLFEKLPTYQFLKAENIVPSDEKTYTKKQIADALEKHFGKLVYFKCDNHKALNEVWYFHNLKGSLLGENFAPIDALSGPKCPENGIKFPKKGSHSKPSDPGKTRRGYLQAGQKKGCVISNGNWYEHGTCATYRVSPLKYGGVTLKSSKGYCNVNDDGSFICNSGVDPSRSQFQISEKNYISYGGKEEWCLLREHNSNQYPLYLSNGKCDSFRLLFKQK